MLSNLHTLNSNLVRLHYHSNRFVPNDFRSLNSNLVRLHFTDTAHWWHGKSIFKFQSGATALHRKCLHRLTMKNFKFQSGATAFTPLPRHWLGICFFKFQSGATALAGFTDVKYSILALNSNLVRLHFDPESLVSLDCIFKFQSGATAFHQSTHRRY